MEQVVNDHDQSSSQTIMAALSTLTPTQFSDLIHSLSSDFHLQNHRLLSLLSSPTRFSHTLQFLQSLSLHNKTLLIARHLLKTLRQLTIIWEAKTHTSLNTTNMGSTRIRLIDADAISLLLLLCEVHQHKTQVLHNHPQTEWRRILIEYAFNNTLMTVSGMGFSSTSLVLCPYIDIVIKCRRFLDAMNGSGGGKVSREVAASAAAVVALRSVQVNNGGVKVIGDGLIRSSTSTSVECVICKEEMKEGRDVCEMPCEHLFHWICILPWLKKRNTCPCCRFQIPTDDVFGEIDRLWRILITKSAVGCCSGARRNLCGEL